MQKIRSGTLAALLLGSIITPTFSLAAQADSDAIRQAALRMRSRGTSPKG